MEEKSAAISQLEQQSTDMAARIRELASEKDAARKEAELRRLESESLKRQLDEMEANHASTEKSLRAEIELLSSVKSSLEVDNDELLVQLGLYRELQQQEAESYEAAVSSLRSEIELQKKICDDMKLRLNASVCSKESCVGMEAGFDEKRDHEQITRLDGSSNGSASKFNCTSPMSRSLQKPEYYGTSTDAIGCESDSKYEYSPESLTARCRSLDEKCAAQQQMIEQLTLKLKQHEAVIAESASAHEGEELRFKLHDLNSLYRKIGDELNEKDQLVSSLQAELRHCESQRDMSRIEIQDLQSKLLTVEQRLDETKVGFEPVRIIELEAQLLKREQEYNDLIVVHDSMKLDLHESQSRLMDVIVEKENAAQELDSFRVLEDQGQVELDRREQGLTQLHHDNADKQKKIDTLCSQIECLEDCLSKANDEKECLKAELDEIRQRLSHLQSDYEGNAIDDLVQSIRRKDEELSVRLTELEALRIQVTSCEANLQAKEEETSMLSDQLSEMSKDRKEATRQATVDILEAVSSKSDKYSTECMRRQIIALAESLEKAELQRAQAMERVLRERKANAENLKKMGETVKRFYATIALDHSV